MYFNSMFLFKWSDSDSRESFDQTSASSGSCFVHMVALLEAQTAN